MRNFKKFLALVLAMLMVSACAVSVSAFDDVKEGDKYAEAIELLADLGVVSGRGDGKFYPGETLTREEAAVIAAKILAGAQSIDWNEATTRFTDVVDEWSFAYINYVDDEGVIYGRGGDIFDPKAALRIDEALKIAVAVADPVAARKADLEYAKNPSLGWAAYYIDAADTLGLTEGITIRKYDIPCTRGMFAQVIATAFNMDEVKIDENGEEVVVKEDVFGLRANFGFDSTKAYVKVADGVVGLYVDQDDTTPVKKVAEKMFNDALAAEGYKVTAAELQASNSKVYFAWFATADGQKIADLAVLTTFDSSIYSQGIVKNVYDKDNKLVADYIMIGDVKYEVGVPDAEGTDKGIIGGTVTDVVGVYLTINGKDIGAGKVPELPDYFKAYYYDDNDDDNWDRCDIVEYVVATISVAPAAAADKVDVYTVKFTDNTPEDAEDNPTRVANIDTQAANITGEFVADGETPVLVLKNWDAAVKDKIPAVDVIEKAEAVTEILTSLIPETETAPAAAVIGDKTYNYAETNFNVPGSTSLKKTITIYTINDEIVNISADSFVDLQIIVDKATINADGKVVLSGLDKDYKAVDYILEGQLKNGKYVPVAGNYEVEDDDNKNLAKIVFLGGTKTDGVYNEDGFEFVEGGIYALKQTKDGVYLVDAVKLENGDVKNVLDLVDDEYVYSDIKFAVDSEYVYVNGVATFHNDKAIIVTLVIDEDNDNAYGALSYKTSTAFEEAEGVYVGLGTPAGTKISFICIADDGSSKSTVKSVDELGQTIVQILGTYISADFDYFYYNAVDLLTGKVVTVASTIDDLGAGEYALAKNNVLVEEDGELVAVVGTSQAPNWLFKRTITYKAEGSSVIKKIKAKPLSGEIVDDELTIKIGAFAEFGWPMITVYTAGADGVIDTKDGAAVTAKADATITKESESFLAYVVEGKIIIIK